jgi:hypothetical protein
MSRTDLIRKNIVVVNSNTDRRKGTEVLAARAAKAE